MKRRKTIKNYLLALLLIFSVFFNAPRSYAGTVVDYFDSLLANNEYILYTDVEIGNDAKLQAVLSWAFSESNYSEYWNSWQDYSQLSLTPTICDLGEHSCDIKLIRRTYSSEEVVKTYDDVSIVVDSNISSYFPMVNGDNVEINYDDSMFSSEEEKKNYINNYMNSFQTNDGSQGVYYSYREDGMASEYYVYRNETVNGRVKKSVIKKISSVVFNYVEEPYSADFAKLTTGTLSIKTDVDINESILSQYLNAYSAFNMDGNIKNNKVFIKMSKWQDGQEVVMEKHLVTLVKDSNVDLNLFNRIGYKDKLSIHADTPTEPGNYLNNYLNMTSYYFYNDDGSQEYYEEFIDYNNPSPSNIFVLYVKKNEHYETLGVQIHTIPVEFSGYDSTYSEEYSTIVGDTLIINADSLSTNNIQMRLQGNTYLLGCNNNYSVCDIALYDYDNKTVEIHKVNIVLDNTVSDRFKNDFKLKEDGTIDVILGNDVAIGLFGFYVSSYNSDTGDYMQYDCYGQNKCSLRLTNYSKNISEVHDVNYNIVNAGRSRFYGSLIKESVDVYPGESTNYWLNISNSWNLFAKKQSTDSAYSSAGCDSLNKKCSIAILGENGTPEIHNSNVVIKEGMSPEYRAKMPVGTLELNAVSGDDDIVYYASQAYLLSKTKTYSYLEDYNGNTAKIVYNGLERHTVNVSLVNEKQEARDEINQAISKIGRQKFNFDIDDLEYVNLFYYKDPSLWGLGNYNSKTINDEFSKIVNNKHIGYYFVEQGGAGDRFMEEAGGGILLYYDGVAYDDANASVTTNIKHAIYIPDDTPSGKDNYIKAAQKRIDDYLGANSGVTISYSEKLENGYETWLSPYFNLDGFDGNCYRISYKDKQEDVLIFKDSSKMQTATFVASDVNNNITVSSDNANYPTNTVVSAENIKENTAKHKELLKKLGLKKAQIVDIDLYSPTTGDIKNFDGVDFNVSIPIDDEKVEGNQLYAYYIAENGRIEEHPVQKDDFMGNFEATHFSTYVISGKIADSVIQKANNPGTYDDIAKWENVLFISVIGLAGVALSTVIRKKSARRQ